MVLLVGSLLAVVGCRVDVVVDLTVRADGTGELVVMATADAEVVEEVPGLAEDLRFDDAIAAGWSLDGPAPTDTGGLTVTLRHTITSADEANNLLASLGPPFTGVRLTRTTSGDTTTVELDGQLALTGGFDAFADADLVAAIGGRPFAADLAASEATPADSMSVRLRAALPGDVESTTGTGVDGALEWDAPLDGGALDLSSRAVQRPAPGWATIVSVTAVALLIVWIVFVAAVALSIIKLRRRRTRF